MSIERPNFTDQPHREGNEETELEIETLRRMALEKAKKYIKNNRVSMHGFRDSKLYGEEGVDRDNAFIDQRIQGFEENKSEEKDRQREWGFIFEAMFFDVVQRQHWFGEKSFVSPASRFDNIKQGVDGYVCFPTTAQKDPEILAIDCTISDHSDTVEQKIGSIEHGIETKKLYTIKYFKNGEEKTRRKTGVPKVIVGLDQEHLERCAKQWIEGDEAVLTELKLFFLERIEIQLRCYQVYTQSKHPDPKIVKKYNQLISRFEQLKASLPDTDNPVKDRVDAQIKKRIQRMGGGIVL